MLKMLLCSVDLKAFAHTQDLSHKKSQMLARALFTEPVVIDLCEAYFLST
jgi:hypothetical protein